ncbi:MAG: MFS transporter [Candidatus Shapirobacteria bacterium]|jgi:MFS family permease
MLYKKRLERNIFLSYVSTFLVSWLFFIPIWFSFETQFANPGLLSVIYALTYVITIILEIPTGALADLIGRKSTVITGSIIQGLGWILISQSKGVEWLWCGYGIGAIGGALISGANTALVYDSLKELGRERYFARFSSLSGLLFRVGMIFSSFLGGYIYLINKGLPYILVGVNYILAGIVTFLIIEPKIDSEKFSFQNYLRQTGLGVKHLLANEKIKWYSVYYMIIGGTTWYFQYFLNQSYATLMGFDEIQRSWLFSSVFLIIGVLGLFIAKHVSKYKFFIVMLPVLTIVGYFSGAVANSLVAIVAIFLVQFTGTLRFSILDQYANDQIESRYRATALSVLNMSVSLVFVVLSLGLSSVIDSHGAKIVMGIMGMITLIAGVPATIKVLVNERNGK